MVEIEDGVPLPRATSPKGGRPRKYPFPEMQIGQSIFVAGQTSSQISGSISGAMRRYGFRFTRRNVEGGVRVWRVK